MNIMEVQEKKRLVERQIRDLIVKFSEETGLGVKGIDADIRTISTVGGGVEYVSGVITLNVVL